MAERPTVVALIPARAGSKRVKGKNTRYLGAHPVIAYTIAAALHSKIFSAVIVSTDSEETAEIARYYGAEVPFLRPAKYAEDLSPDIEWIDDTLRRLQSEGRTFDCFSILRPTSPFRQPETIQRAWQAFIEQPQVDSLRAIEKCKQHPGKMWLVLGDRMKPLLAGVEHVLTEKAPETPWHSTPYQALPAVYVQNASLEIARSHVVLEQGTIAGSTLMPFLTEGYEGFDINDVKDWWYAEHLLAQGDASLPTVSQPPFSDSAKRH